MMIQLQYLFWVAVSAVIIVIGNWIGRKILKLIDKRRKDKSGEIDTSFKG